AIGAYQQAADYRPDWANPYRHWALALESQGKLAEAEAKYRQALERTGDSADGLHQTGMRCLEQGRVVEAMACQRAALAVQPAHGEARYELGKMLAQRRNLKEAEVHLREAVRLLPRHADAWHRLGNVLRHQKRFAEAEPYYREAIRLNPTATDVYNHLGIDLLDQGRPEQAEAQFREGLRLRPDFSEAANNLGVSLEQQGRLDEALAAYQESLRHKPDAADTHKNLALAWLLTGNFEQGWPEYEWRWKTREAVVRPFPQPRWDGKPLAGEPVLLHAEQGLGDVLQFVRYAPLVRQRGGTVVLECPARLIPLLQRCPGIDRLVPQGKPAPDCAYQVPLLSLPTIFRTTLETVPAAVPYLSADPERVERWRERISGEGLRIGIAWQGSPRYVGDRHRSIALKHFEPLAQLPGVRLFSLQIGHGSEQLKAVCQRWGVVDLATAGLDKDGAFVDSAAVLQHLDLLVCSDSALAHLAGALGVPVWMALPRARDWRWLLDREDSPWYPTMRLFRQRRWGDWDEVFTRIAQQLSTLPHGVRVGRPLTVPVDLGDFFDQLAASQARVQQAKASDQLASSQIRLGALLAVQARCIRPSAELTRLAADLRAVHSSLWQIKQSMHGYERHGDFGPQFTELARELCRQQGVREKLKQAIQRLSAGERVSVSGGQRT
ncbi:MAG TPA: tetratricopeptide repeat-containing glycosyltransferase family protein, partial [Gemmataceae bacterium]|nr:tetratricopeptide repeat-containing glycosyltransferase family protein [Gemmataceae bacterium]